jgi:uncharacterized cupin superfamily protein
MGMNLGRRDVLNVFLAIAGTLAVVLAWSIFDGRAGFLGYKEKLAKTQPIEMKPSPLPPAWLVSGSPTFRTGVFGRSHDNSAESGIWECIGPTQFVWQYVQDETIHVLEGSAEVEYLGKKFTLKAGDSTSFAAGTSANWVVRERIRKTWTLYEPGRIVRVMRRLVG